ncbi:uncharacterized protein E0L32_009991 [Thyridium curvatum]|uniref:inositol-3-phosphate synthase n=1 Tax=Thyridium curvatum TaxID=1093900 RepID=A0A507APT6_9PEZI|nr:uncharacterized protein E0L32_009991 [Thyridium curvatum]TPX08504.1 hypothetical protein E0L32_009991 [Thyridium curvatum]
MTPHAEAETASSNWGLWSNGSYESPSSSRELFTVNSPNVVYRDDEVLSKYTYRTTTVTKDASTGQYIATPTETRYDFRVDRRIPKVGVMLVGWGGNNGTTVTAGLLANRRGLVWDTREGPRAANYYGSLVMGSTMKLGIDAEHRDVNIPLHNVLPMVHPNDLMVGGWDISNMNLAEAMDRAAVLQPTLKMQLKKEMAQMVPLPSIYYPDFIASNQSGRANHVLPGDRACMAHVDQIRKDIRSDFKSANNLDKVVVLWTANTERYADIVAGINDTADNLLEAITQGHKEIAPSTIFAVASILEKTPFINGSPQNTFVPGAIDLAQKHGVFIGGDDFKSGQTKMKSALVEFLINAGIKLVSIASYNHLGNNDGRNLSEQKQFRSKEISKSNVVDDMVEANTILYKEGEHPDHTVVIKYMPAVGDDKRALDEYYAEIFLGGHQTISIFNVCEDSLLASPLIIDLVLITEMMTRIQWRSSSSNDLESTIPYESFHSVLSILSYMLKAPLTPPGTPVVNALGKQRAALINIFRACVGLEPESDLALEHRLF